MCHKKLLLSGNFLAVQWFRVCAFIDWVSGSISGQGTKISQSVWHGEKKKNEIGIKRFGTEVP